jgi:hypothetical protein
MRSHATAFLVPAVEELMGGAPAPKRHHAALPADQLHLFRWRRLRTVFDKSVCRIAAAVGASILAARSLARRYR